MTTLTIRWLPATTSVANLPIAQDVFTLLRLSPLHILSGTTSVVLIPGESVELAPGGPLLITIDIPRLKTIYAYGTVPEGERATLELGTDGLLTELADRRVLTKESSDLRPRTSRGDLPTSRYEIKTMTIDVNKGLRQLAPVAASSLPRQAVLEGADSAVTVSGTLPVSLSARVSSRKTLPRYMMIPYASSAANECRVIPVTPVGASTRLRVEPTDPAAVLLMDYLIAGKFVLACVAARAVEKERADRDPLEWATPSYCQLLIGYSYALGRDAKRLERWCRRTDAAGSLGTDGLVLAAEAARLQRDSDGSVSAIEQVAEAPPPLLIHGADIGLRIVSVLLAEIDEKSEDSVPLSSRIKRLRDVRSNFMRLLFVADAESSPLSIPTANDLKAALAVSRFRYTLHRTFNWLASGWRQRYSLIKGQRTQNRQYLVGAAMTNDTSQSTPTSQSAGTPGSASSSDSASSSPKLVGTALWVAIFAIVVWIGFSVFLIAKAGTNETEWARIAWVFGSIQAVAFAAAGALFGTTVQQQNVNNAQQQAASAKKDADQQRDAATKGRAFAAAIQAEAVADSTDSAEGPQRMGIGDGAGAAPADELLQRHARLSRALFGDLV